MAPNAEDTGRIADTDIARERNKAAPDAGDLTDSKEVWKNGETVPSRSRAPQSGMLGRVADAGDLGQRDNPPYPTEVQADAVVDQRPRGDVEHPERVFSDERQEAKDKLTQPMNKR
jgi:hypothetical protein